MTAVPESDVIKGISVEWQILNDPANPTIPSDNPKKCIGYILVSKTSKYSFKVEQSVVENGPVASDHLPVWVKVRIDK